MQNIHSRQFADEIAQAARGAYISGATARRRSPPPQPPAPAPPSAAAGPGATVPTLPSKSELQEDVKHSPCPMGQGEVRDRCEES